MEHVHETLIIALLGMLYVIFRVHISSLIDNRKNNFLVQGEGPIYGIKESFGLPEKNCSINFSKANTKFCLSLHHNHNGGNSYLFVNGKEIF